MSSSTASRPSESTVAAARIQNTRTEKPRHKFSGATLRQLTRLTQQTYLQGVFQGSWVSRRSRWGLQVKEPSGETPTQLPIRCAPKNHEQTTILM